MVNNKKLFLIFSLILLFILPALSSAISFSDLFSFLGITSEEPEHHTVYLVSPGNNSYTNNNNDTLAFNFNHTGFLTGVVNCILYLDGTAVKYTTDVTADQNTAVYSNVSITETTHNWWVNCTNGTGGESSIDVGGNFTFTADYTPPHSINTCQDLTIENGNYILMQDISSSETCFTVGASNITLDCQGYTIDGNDTTSTYGVYVSDSAYGNGTIKNCVLTDWYYGVYVRYADNYSIINNTVESNWRGIQTHDSNNNFIAGNTVKYHPSSAAITLHASSGNMVINNTANSNSYGIFLYNNSDDNNIIGNTANSNTYSGFYLGDSSSNSLMNNTVQSNGDNGIGLLPGSGSNIIINNYASSN
ncbi:MAG: hypothetical protein GQ477_00215, partial [Nanohaloarchaea archaeon]|nr:hypothetical protein [Candidatus Nanohaloarchaea archaeon]